MLEKAQKGQLDVTVWIAWFLNCLKSALELADVSLRRVMRKARFWKNHAKTELNNRQQKIVNRLLDGFDGKLTSSRWSRMGKCSKDTAVRDINDLIAKEILVKEKEGGRSTHYELSEKAFE
jgi:Fic family protein